jgi:hypothetical protein
MTAARICAINRVRAGPIRRNRTMVIAMAKAAADSPIAATTPKAANHLTPPLKASTSTNGVDSSSAMPVTEIAIETMRMEKMLGSVAGDDMMRSRSARA